MADLRTRLLVLQLQQQQLVMEHVHLLTRVAYANTQEPPLEPNTIRTLGERLNDLGTELKKLEAMLV